MTATRYPASDQSGARRLVNVVIRGFAIVLVFGVIWAPWIAHNYVPEPQLTPEIIAEARWIPDDALLRELGGYDLYPPLPWTDDHQLVKAAEKLLLHQVELPGFPATRIEYPLGASAMASGPTMWQLFLHSLGIPRVLLDAYKVDGRSQFLVAAADYLVAYDAYERSAWGPDGFIWNDAWRRFPRNDHAVASRVPVLTHFWGLYRHSPNYRPDVGAAVLRMAARAAYFVADPAHFTVATNHGVMQNLAACNITLAFPGLPGVEGYCRLASSRLDEQLAFFINDEGFVLEHSPGYQSFSLRLIGIALRYMTLAKMDIPQSWLRKYHAAQRVYANLRRPDGSLPTFGDTDGGTDGAGPMTVFVDGQGHASPPAPRKWKPENDLLLAPVAGYALWWDNLDAWPDLRVVGQTAIGWSYFPGMGHKHADEMSLAVWARGTSWWGNVGYWPYGVVGRRLAESWEGSNAPHMVGERADGARETRLLFHGRDGNLAMLDLERHGPESYRARRQVVHVGERIWIVIDSSSGAPEARTRTVWTTSPSVRMTKREAADEYSLTDERSGESLRAFFLGAPDSTWSILRGRQSPFAGWLVVGGIVQPAQAVVVERPADGAWQLASWSLVASPVNAQSPGSGLSGPPQMQRWDGADDWELKLPSATGTISIKRRKGRVDTIGAEGRTGSLQLEPGPDVSMATADLNAALKAGSAKYGTADMSGVYRLKVTLVLLVALLLNVVLLRAARRLHPQWAPYPDVVLSAWWMLLGFYFILIRAQLV